MNESSSANLQGSASLPNTSANLGLSTTSTSLQGSTTASKRALLDVPRPPSLKRLRRLQVDETKKMPNIVLHGSLDQFNLSNVPPLHKFQTNWILNVRHDQWVEPLVLTLTYVNENDIGTLPAHLLLESFMTAYMSDRARRYAGHKWSYTFATFQTFKLDSTVRGHTVKPKVKPTKRNYVYTTVDTVETSGDTKQPSEYTAGLATGSHHKPTLEATADTKQKNQTTAAASDTKQKQMQSLPNGPLSSHELGLIKDLLVLASDNLRFSDDAEYEYPLKATAENIQLWNAVCEEPEFHKTFDPSQANETLLADDAGLMRYLAKRITRALSQSDNPSGTGSFQSVVSTSATAVSNTNL